MSRAERPVRSREEIVVTGLGAVTAFGWSARALWSGVRTGATTVAPIDRFDPSRHRTRLAAQVPTPEATLRAARRTSLADRFAVAAAHEACAQAVLDPARVGLRVGVYFGSSTGGMLESERYYETLVRRGARRARPGWLASQQLNGPGDAVARAVGAHGPVETVSSACASGAMAIGAALRALRRGDCDVAIAGGSDSLCQLTYAGFNALRSVDERPSRPFRADRTGLSLGEGAGVLVLEGERAAARRGARAIATLAGEASTCDASHMTAPHPRGAGAAEAIALALEDASTDPSDVDFINAHGTGTPLNDAAEAAAIRSVFGERAARIPVTSTKSLIAHLLGSAGAVEAVVTAMCLEKGEVHPMPDDGARDAEIGLDLVLGVPRRLPKSTCALSTSLAFGGANAALILRRGATA